MLITTTSGLGTASPSTPLHVVSSSGTQLNLERTGTTSAFELRLTRGNRTDQGLYTDGPGIALRGTDASNGATQVRIAGDNVNANNYDRIEFTTENIERMRIDSSGRLLVGTTTEGEPNANNLTIADTGNCGLTLRSGGSNYGAIYFSDATSGMVSSTGISITIKAHH